MFRVQTTDGQWVATPTDSKDIELSEDKADAWVFPACDLVYWEGNDGYKIAPLAEDELLGRLGQSRLEGFE